MRRPIVASRAKTGTWTQRGGRQQSELAGVGLHEDGRLQQVRPAVASVRPARARPHVAAKKSSVESAGRTCQVKRVGTSASACIVWGVPTGTTKVLAGHEAARLAGDRRAERSLQHPEGLLLVRVQVDGGCLAAGGVGRLHLEQRSRRLRRGSSYEDQANRRAGSR
jgi:hypothetical protein